MLSNKKSKSKKTQGIPPKKSDVEDTEDSSPAKKSSLQQLFAARNASFNRTRKQKVGKETEKSAEVPQKRKKRDEEEEPPLKKARPEQEFPRGPSRVAQRNKKKVAKQRSKEEEERLGQTLFVGNLPLSATRKSLEKLFGKFGIVESVRLRGAIPVKAKISKKVADITRKFHEGLHSRKGFVVFRDSEGAEAALALNGTLLEEHHIIVDRASGSGQKKTYEPKRTIFVGNLPFDVDDESVWNAFSPCGEVEAVRVIRDKATGAGKGFGYVLFTSESSRQFALKKEKVEVDGRQLRIKSVEGGSDHKKNNKNFAHGRALQKKRQSEHPQSRKSTKKLLKREKAKHDKKKVAQGFNKFF